jgi:hypothetical protein
MELAIHGSNQDDIEDFETVVVGCRVPTRGEKVKAVDTLFACTKITSDGDGLCECSSREDEKDGQKRKREKEGEGHCVC